MKLTLEQIDQCFAATHQADALTSLYRLVFPDWDNIAKIDGFPSVNDWTWKAIARRFIQFDALHHPGVFAGGLWMNQGFTTGYGQGLANFEVSIAGVTVTTGATQCHEPSTTPSPSTIANAG